MKYRIRRAAAIVLCAGLVLGIAGAAHPAQAAEAGDSYLSLGADLSGAQRKQVCDMLDIEEDDYADRTVTITNEEEHKYLGDYIPAEQIGTKALSSVLVTLDEEDSGISVTTENIGYCTSGMYKNALATAGAKDVTVNVAAPFKMSGTAALIGAVKAYSEMTGDEIPQDIIDGAIDEMVTTGKLEESLDADDEKIEGMISYLKDEILSGGRKGDISETIDEAAEKFDINLSEDQKDDVEDLMTKLDGLDLDTDSLAKIADQVYDKFKDLGIDREQAKGWLARLIAYLKKLVR